MNLFSFLAGPSDLLARMGSWKLSSKWCRNLHRLIHRFGLTLCVAVSMLQVPVLVKQIPQVIPWPVLLPSSWITTIFNKTHGEPLLGQYKVWQKDSWQEMFREFWIRYRAVFPGHGLFSDASKQDRLHLCVPYMVHGDEGRGKLRRAVMCASMSPVIHQHGHTFLSRFLFSILPAELYTESDSSFEILMNSMVQDLEDLYQYGIEVCPNSDHACIHGLRCRLTMSHVESISCWWGRRGTGLSYVTQLYCSAKPDSF